MAFANPMDAASVADILGVTDAAIVARLAAMDLAVDERAGLRAVAAEVAANADRFTMRLCDQFRGEPELAGMVATEARVAALRRQQETYLRELISAPIDRRYVLDRLRLGLIHHHLLLTPPWYLATYSHFLCAHVDIVFAASASPRQAIDRIIALLKTVMFDAGLALQAYGYGEERALWTSRQREAVAPETQGGTMAVVRPSDPGRPREISRLHLEADVVAARRRFIGIDDDDIASLRAIGADIAAAAPDVMEDFYAWFSRQPETAELMADHVVDRLKRQVTSYWHELSRAAFDRPYAASRMRIGVVHERVGMPPHWYFAGVARQASGFLRALSGDEAAIARRASALLKAMFFDMSFVVDAYMDARVEALLRTEHFANHVVANMVSAVAVLDANGRVRSANRALLQLLRIEPALLYMMPAEQVLNMPALTPLLARHHAEPGQQIVDIVAWGAKTYRVTIMELSEGEGRGGQARAVVLDDVTAVIGYAEKVERSVSGLEAVIDATRAITWEMETPLGTIVAMSQTVLEVLGLRDVHFLGRGEEWLATIPDPDRGTFRRACDGLAPGSRTELEHRMLRAGGSEIWVRTILVRPGYARARPLILGLTIDVTELRVANQRQVEAELHARRMEIVGRLAGGLSHDFNNTLTVISANLELAQARVSDLTAMECLRRARAAAEISAGLNRRLLGYARKGRGDLRPIQVSDRVSALAKLIKPTLGSDVVLRTDLADGLGAVRVDPADFDSAVLNLAMNARDALREAGTIILRTRAVEAGERGVSDGDASDPAAFVSVSVEDDGVGMAPETRARASEPFFSTKGAPASAGLGLHSVARFVEHVGGTLRIDSRLGEGTVVEMLLPVATAIDVAASEGGVVGEVELGDGEIVLVVDADDAVRRATAMLLEGLGYAVALARDAAEALRVLESGVPMGLVLCDPAPVGGMSGHDLARIVRERWPGTGILFMSGDESASTGPASPGLDAVPVLRKPFLRAGLGRMVKAALQAADGGSLSTSPEKT